MSLKRQVLQVSSGTLIGQILSLAFMPIVTRLYLPAEMGDYALSVSIYSIVGIMANLRLDMALVVAKSDEDAKLLTWVAIASSAVVSVLTLAVLVAFRGLNTFSLLTAFAVFITGGVQTLAMWLSRKKKFRQLATRNVLEKALVLLIGLALGLWGYTQFGLIAAQTLGLFAALLYMFWQSQLDLPSHWRKSWLHTVKNFADFPAKNIISSLLFAMALFLPSILFAHHFHLANLGHYNLVTRLFDVPVTLIGYAFSTVYFQHSARRTEGERRRLFWRSVRGLALLAGPPLILVGWLGPGLFSLVFGENWNEAGALAYWLAPYSICRLLYVSQWSLLMVQRRLGLDLALSALLFASQIGGFYLGLPSGDVANCVQWMALLGGAVYLVGLTLIYRSLIRT